MISDQNCKILFFPDLIGGEASGARSGRATLKSLLELGHEVAIFSSDADKVLDYKEFNHIVYFKINSQMRANSHFYDSKLVNQFKKILKYFKPDYYFMAGGIQKPAILAKISRDNNVKNIFLFYITDYYCAKVYSGLESGPCFKCININSLQALTNNCVKGNFKLPNFLKGLVVRKKLMYEVLKSYKVVGYSQDQLNTYKKLGIDEKKCQEISLQFDPEELLNFSSMDGDYFLVLGQPIIEKGFHTISNIIANCKSSPKIRMIFRDINEKKKSLKDFNLLSYVESGIISTYTGLDKRLDILKVISNAKAVIIPSYYPSTGEFVLIESLLLGKPILVFNVGAHKDFITQKINGMVADVGDFKGFAKNIDEINTNHKLRGNISRNGKNFIIEMLSKKNRLQTLGRLFMNTEK